MNPYIASNLSKGKNAMRLQQQWQAYSCRFNILIRRFIQFRLGDVDALKIVLLLLFSMKVSGDEIYQNGRKDVELVLLFKIVVLLCSFFFFYIIYIYYIILQIFFTFNANNIY